MIHLKKVTFKNFKIFGNEPYIINFGQNNLILLDGPNGYGKTSVFDAIELALTGNISRLISVENRQIPTDIVVAHKGNENIEITIEFIDENSNVKIFQRKLKNNPPNALKKISKFTELWELHEIIDEKSITSSQSKLEQYFDSKDFARDFLLFHYVQQEETSQFLKTKNEARRAEELAQLFGNTLEADEKLNKLINIQKKITLAKKTIKAEIQNIKDIYKIDNDTNNTIENFQQHSYAFPELIKSNKSPFWDLPSISDFTKDKLNIALDEISSIKNFIKFQKFYIRNRSFETAIQQREYLSLYLGYYKSLEQYDFYLNQDKTNQLIKNTYNILGSGDLKSIQSSLNLEAIYKTLGLEDHHSFENSLQALIVEETKTNGLNSIYTELIKYHDEISSNIKNIPDESKCILCGHDYLDHDSLAHAIAKHKLILQSELSDKDKILVNIRNTFNDFHLRPLIKACQIYQDQNTAISHENLQSLTKALTNKDLLDRIHKWLLTEKIGCYDLIVNTFPTPSGTAHINEATDQLCVRIHTAIGRIPEGYLEANESNVFDRFYREYFNNSQDQLAQAQTLIFDQKENYLQSLYLNSLTEIYKQLSTLSQKFDLLDKALIDVDRLITSVKTKIRQYRKKLITEIEIPFYIYSGKILQTHQAGLGHGIFIKDPTGDDELKNVRLVSNWESDHDILNTMSSGQISAVVISLTLALHRVYSTKFSTILIDDPVQTMDDINMSSLVEVLRNDFSNKQIILSTHEDKVARYFTYKFLKYSKNVKSVNLMQRKEHVLSNNYVYN